MVGEAKGTGFDEGLALVAADLDKLVRRLRSFSPRAWRERREPARAVLAGLVELSARLEGRRLDPPDVADHVLADAIAVVGGDLLATLAPDRDAAVLGAAQTLIETALNATR